MQPRSAFTHTPFDIGIDTSALQNHGRSSEEIREHVRLRCSPLRSWRNSDLILSFFPFFFLRE